MPMIRLTKRAIDAIPQPPAGQVLYRDIDLPGFGIRIGRRCRAYFVEAQVKRWTIRTTIGRYHLMVPEEARKQAKRLLGEMAAGNNPNAEILVVDRSELEGQMKGWVEKLLGEMQKQDIAVWRANTKAQLQELLTSDKRGLILSMIHKFEGVDKDSNTRDNIYVFIDEAHRSVAKDLGTYLMASVPKATIIGFTGTPIAKTEQGEGTFKIFGKDDERGYLDKYSIAESIDDETTLPIKHMMAPGEMTVPAERLDKEFFELAEAEGVTDIDELNKALDRAVGLRTFLTADDRIEKAAAFVAEHFKENVLPLGYKAFLVGVNREACAKYKRALDKLLPPGWSEPIYTESAADVVDRPLVAELQVRASSRWHLTWIGRVTRSRISLSHTSCCTYACQTMGSCFGR